MALDMSGLVRVKGLAGISICRNGVEISPPPLIFQKVDQSSMPPASPCGASRQVGLLCMRLH